MLLSSQEVNQLSGHVMVPVMQEANLCDLMPLAPKLVVNAKANAGRSRVVVRSTSSATPVKLYARWFLKFNNTNHHKVYNFSTTTEATTSGTTNTYPVDVYPELVMDVPANTSIAMWPEMRSVYKGVQAVSDLQQENRIVQVTVVEFEEAY